jgi:hypothetical protein
MNELQRIGHEGRKFGFIYALEAIDGALSGESDLH